MQVYARGWADSGSTKLDSYAARWSGMIRFPSSDAYTLSVPRNAQIFLKRKDGRAVRAKPDLNGRYAFVGKMAAGEPYRIVVTADKVKRMFLKWQTTDSDALSPTVVPASALTPAVAEFPPTQDGGAYASGSGKMTHFVSLPGGARGMVAYTGVGDVVDFRLAVTPHVATERSHKGYRYVWFTERGLKDGTTLPYAYKAAYPNPVTGDYTLSAASELDYGVVDPKGIPWDTRDPSLIREAVLADTPELSAKYELGILSPDGYEYITQPASKKVP